MVLVCGCESAKEKGVGQKLNVNQTCGWKGEGKDSGGFCWRTRLVSGTHSHNSNRVLKEQCCVTTQIIAPAWKPLNLKAEIQ